MIIGYAIKLRLFRIKLFFTLTKDEKRRERIMNKLERLISDLEEDNQGLSDIINEMYNTYAALYYDSMSTKGKPIMRKILLTEIEIAMTSRGGKEGYEDQGDNDE